jgi:hypothetical protein
LEKKKIMKNMNENRVEEILAEQPQRTKRRRRRTSAFQSWLSLTSWWLRERFLLGWKFCRQRTS